jgi:serine protease AprX
MLRSLKLTVLICLLAARAAWAGPEKLDALLTERAQSPRGTSRVLVTTTTGRPATDAIRAVGGVAGRFLHAAGQVALVQDAALYRLADRPEVRAVRLDRTVAGTVDRTGSAVGATWVRDHLGFDGSGVGIAVIDSGITTWHDDLGSLTVVDFTDFVRDLPTPHDDYGHGTHVAGTIAGNGYDSDGVRAGIAPGASLVVLKVLDESGHGHISNVIAALDYAVENRSRFNIRVINLSVASGVYESYTTDPLTQAARRAVEAGIVVVTAAGNLGRTSRGAVQYGGITSPGNAPWVITVGATDGRRTATRSDDVVAPFSSRGPTHIDRAVKPDLLAPGVGIESMAAAGSTLYDLHADARIWGSIDTATPPYIALTGTSMAAPVVTGTIALMLEANPALTPNLVKAILHYTAERRPRVESSAQGAGLLNARGAVQLALALAGGEPGAVDPTRWSRQILWGNGRVRGGTITAEASAWRVDVLWGAQATPEGDPIVWGTSGDGEARWELRRDDLTVFDVPLSVDLFAAADSRFSVWGAISTPPAVPRLHGQADR